MLLLQKFEEAGVPSMLIGANWLLPLFSMTVPPPTLHRLWDVFFSEGPKVLLVTVPAPAPKK